MMQSIFVYDMKRYLLLFLLPLYSIVDSSAYDFEKDGIYYAIKNADNLEVKVVPKAEFTTSYSGDVTMPESVEHEGNTYRVTEIFINAFADCQDLTSVVLPKSIVEVKYNAFLRCAGLKNVVLEEGLINIYPAAFCQCTNLTSVTIPGSVHWIDTDAFALCTGLQSINMIEGVDTIGPRAFRGCTSLTSVTIPKSVVIIWDGAFAGCKNLATLMIPESVKFIEEYAFNGTAWYDSQPDGPVYINDILCQYKGKIPPGTRLTVREKTSYISGSAFKDQPGLLSVILPEGIPSINNDLFSGCTGLESVSIPRSVTIIKWNAFKDCTSLSSITLPEKVSSIGSNVFNGCSNLKEVKCKAVIPPSCPEGCFFGVEQRDCKLYVAEGSVEAYRNAPVWQNFDIIATDFSGIEEIRVDEELDETQSPLYDLQGRRVTGTPERGLYIRNGKKVWIK